MTRSELATIDFTLFEPPPTEGYEIKVLWDEGWGLTIHAFYPNNTSSMFAQLCLDESCDDEGIRNVFSEISWDGVRVGWHIGPTKIDLTLKTLEAIQRLQSMLWPNPSTLTTGPSIEPLDRILTEGAFDD
jgi:hypothetical protein